MKELYEKYADLLLTRCLNITNEKSLLINAPIESIEFVRILAKQAYQLGINDIYFDWEDEELKHDQLKTLNTDSLCQSNFWNKAIFEEYAKKKAAILMLDAGDSGLMDDINPEKLQATATVFRTSRPLYKKLQLSYQIPWCIAAVATDKWSKKVFPTADNAKEKLWNLIFECCLITSENPIEEWNKKINNSNNRKDILNSYRFEELNYKNNIGTDLTIKLPDKHLWYSAGKKIVDGKDGIVNMPTEEVFTSPDRCGVNGVVYSSRPLVYNGSLIDDFYLEFENGKVVNFDAKIGLELLKEILKTCENADRLGEVALVDNNSPISNTNVVFYNTLFDENASCHFALGCGFPNCYENGKIMTEEELLEVGINQSKTHIDFMIGTPDLSIVGTTHDKQKIKVFENGNFIIK